MVTAQQLILAKYANFNEPIVFDSTEQSNFKLITKEYETQTLQLSPDELFIQVIYLSNDPAQKGWFTPYKSYKRPTPLGEIAPANGIARIIKSGNPSKFPEGAFIDGFVGWCDYGVISSKGCHVIPQGGQWPLVKHLSAFGGTTMTAYFSVLQYAPQGEGKIWLITGAAGATGSSCIQLIQQIMKPKLIIGVAGGKDKCRWVESLGEDVKCLDYKDPQYKKKFHTLLAGQEVDTFIDHVGGWLLNHSVLYMKDFGYIVQVGAISGYNSSKDGFSNYASVISKRLTIKGMVIVDHFSDFPAAFKQLAQWFKDGTLDINNFPEHIVNAIGPDFRNVPALWQELFQGVNRGKYITQVAAYRDSPL